MYVCMYGMSVSDSDKQKAHTSGYVIQGRQFVKVDKNLLQDEGDQTFSINSEDVIKSFSFAEVYICIQSTASIDLYIYM